MVGCHISVMTRTDKIEWAGCPVRYAAGIFGDKWAFVILRDVLLHGKRFYGDFQRSEERISSNILAARLAHLEASGMLTRHVDQRKKSRVYYLPTAKAQALLPALLALMVWSTEHDDQTDAPPSFARAVNEDPGAAVQWYRDEITEVNTRLGLEGGRSPQ